MLKLDKFVSIIVCILMGKERQFFFYLACQMKGKKKS